MLAEIVVVFGALFAIMNPLSTTLVFLNLTTRFSQRDKRRIAFRAAFAAFIALTIFLFIGQAIMSFFSITIYAFRVAGGLYLLKIGFEMLGPQPRRNVQHYESDAAQIAVVPLAIPLLSGPGALTSVLVLGSEYSYVVVVIGSFIVCLLSWFILRESTYIQKALGRLGSNVLERVMGILVLAVAVQFIFNGILGFLAVV